jgi:hypothetical protein
MKKILLFFALLMMPFLIMAQDTTNLVIQHVSGQGALAFLKSNLWTLILFVLFVVSEWMGESGKFPEGSIYRKLCNLIIAFVKGKANITYKSKKMRFAEPLKIALIGIMLSGFALNISAQVPGKWDLGQKIHDYAIVNSSYQFSDVSKSGGFKSSDTIAISTSYSWIFRTGASATATQLYISNGKIKSSAFVGAGYGISYSHYKTVTTSTAAGLYTNTTVDWGINLMGSVSTDTNNHTMLSAIVGISYLKVISIGVGYNFTDGILGVFPQVTWTFD